MKMHCLWCQVLLVAGLPVQCVQQIGCSVRPPGVAVNGEHIAAIADFDSETAFYLMQVLIKLTAKISQAAVVVGLESDSVSGR